MYAVYILAAILLSVAPMHASTVLASLPAAASGQRTVCSKRFAGQQASHELRGSATFVAHIPRVQQALNQAPSVAWLRWSPSVISGVHLLAHAPNAP